VPTHISALWFRRLKKKEVLVKSQKPLTKPTSYELIVNHNNKKKLLKRIPKINFCPILNTFWLQIKVQDCNSFNQGIKIF